ncbi:transcriptional repressor [Geotalea uraniireducens]|uniref:Transcriptional repressor n=1 Tax=Geotalea uraniireducens TaxID=351604 RepID=A0ABN6VT26_9BACT|nr:transcriptional repressor [Geotalea uraniireducens]BDV41322.1 transcriptional repressor [Geotalea uraniireducens]
MKFQPAFKDNKIKHLEECCRKEGLPVTIQRRLVLEALAERTDHPSADQLFEAVRDRLPGISRTTVYRVLETLEELGVVQRINHQEARVRFDAETRHHHHLLCTRCHKVVDLRDPELDKLNLPPFNNEGFAVSGFTITVSGICPACRD